MHGVTISEAARQTGFSESTLRYYERQGVVVPGRTPAGYRAYSERDIDALHFVVRAKGMGLALPEIAELVALLDKDDCGPVQEKIAGLVSTRIAEAQANIADLAGFTARLQETAARLKLHTPDGPCDGGCGCTSNPVPSTSSRPATAVRLAGDNDAIACSLDAHQFGDRIAEWQSLVGTATGREPVQGGIRLLFARDADAGAIATLAMAEQTCCSFFRFNVGIAPEAVWLDVTGPDAAQPVIAAMMGVAV